MVGFETWKDFYGSDLQSPWAVIVVPVLFLLWLARGTPPAQPGAEPAAAAFVRRYAVVFGVLTIVDPLCTGPLVRAIGLGGATSTAVMLLFVALGDWRVYFLLFALRDGAASLAPVAWRAVRWTLVVPVFAWPAYRAVAAIAPGIPDETLWMLYEWAFAALALVLRHGLVSDATLVERPALRAWLRAVLAYVAVYYALWAISDALLLGLRVDAGWALRAIPNQLYYALWIPFVYFSFFSRRYAATRSAVHAAR